MQMPWSWPTTTIFHVGKLRTDTRKELLKVTRPVSHTQSQVRASSCQQLEESD